MGESRTKEDKEEEEEEEENGTFVIEALSPLFSLLGVFGL